MSRETVLITGASSGIGREMAKLFAADGSKVILAARRLDRLEALAEEIRATGGEAIPMRCDLLDPAAPQKLFDDLAAENIEVDVLVNNAGFGGAGKIAALPIERQLGMISLNIAALTHLTRLFLPPMLARRRGGILNVGSIAGFQSGANQAVYCATKAYVLSFTEALAAEVAGSGVTVTLFAPGLTDTEFVGVAKLKDSLLVRLGSMNAAVVARIGHRGFRRGKIIVVPGFWNKLLVLISPRMPRAWVRNIAKRLQSID
jgi:short-subunit dehydrogenase